MPIVNLVLGRVGAGKTTYGRTLGGVVFVLDDWMRNLYTMDAPQPLTLEWMMPRVERAERQIWAVAEQILDRGVDVVLELGFFTRAQRDRVRSLTTGRDVRVHVVDAPADVRRERVRARNRGGDTFSIEVDDATFDWAERYFEALDDDELRGAVIVAT